MAGQKGQSIGFGAFEIDLATGELRRDGIRIKLQDQPFAVLALLLEKPGELVTREEFRERIWGADTYVDFDQGLNKAIKNIRAALGDSAEQPFFIETLPKRGYRFIAPLSSGQLVASEPPADVTVAPPRNSWPRRIAVISGLLLAGSLLLVFLIWHNRTPKREIRLKQLTTNSSENFVESSVVSPDGRSLLYGDQLGIHLRVISTGETHNFKKPSALSDEDLWFPRAWFPDQTHFLAVSQTLTSQGVIPTVWDVSLMGDGAVKLREKAFAESVSPDGSLIAFTTGGIYSNEEIWVMGANGEDARALSKSENSTIVCCMTWLPDGQRILDLKTHWSDVGKRTLDAIESRDLRGGPAIPIVSHVPSFDDSDSAIEGLGVFTDGRVLYSQRVFGTSPAGSDGSNLWEQRINLKTGRPTGKSRQLTRWFEKDSLDTFSTSSDGKTFILQKENSQAHTYLGEVDRSRPLRPLHRLTLEDTDEYPFAWTPDSKAVLFTSNRSGVRRLYKQLIEEKLAETINTGPGAIGGARVSPDGQWIIYPVWPANGLKPRLMRVSVSGGAPREIRELGHPYDVGCSSGPDLFCSTGEIEHGRQVISSFDVNTGQSRRLFTLPIHNNESLVALDGGVESSREDSAGTTLSLLSPTGRVEREINLAPWHRLGGLDRSHDGKIYTTSAGPSGTIVLRVQLSGKIEPLWYMQGSQGGWAIPAPDGRHIAVLGKSTNSNTWLVENF